MLGMKGDERSDFEEKGKIIWPRYIRIKEKQNR